MMPLSHTFSHAANATVAEYGLIDFDKDVVHKIKSEIYTRGPVAATVNAEPVSLGKLYCVFG